MSKLELRWRTSRPYLRFAASRLIYTVARGLGYRRDLCVLAAVVNFCAPRPWLSLRYMRGGK